METKRICPSCQKTLTPNVPLGLCPECLIKSGFNTGTEPGNPGKESGFVPPPVEELRKLFPQLEIIELIGKGGMGAVYKARQLALDRLVALKILPPGAADDAGFAERFNREARALARLNHPHIVAVHDFGQAGGQPYLVMEFVDGPNLRQVEQAGRLMPEQALEIVPQICEALQFAHNEGVVHRDIKPENILLDKKGRVKITDFGIAKIVGVPAGKSALTGAKDVLGTPHYMAPEQVEKPQTVDHRADIYSLGVVFYELLTGELPLGKFQPPSKKVRVDVRLDEVVLHTLEKEPERRYQHVCEVKTDVETIAATLPSGGSRREEAQTGKAGVSGQKAEEHQSLLTSAATGLKPRFSSTALFGATLGIAFVLSGVPFVFKLVNGPAFPGVFMMLLGACSMTLCGWVAISQIRHSPSRHYGLGLAMFDGLLFPLLALNGLLVWFWNYVGDELAGACISILGRGLYTVLMVGLITASCGIASWLITRAAWRAANKPLDNGRLASAHTAAPPPAPHTTGAWKVAAVIVAGVMIMLAIPIGAILLWVTASHSARQRVPVTAYDPSQVAAVEQKLTRAVEDRLRAADYRFDSVFVNVVSAKYDQTECLIEGLQRGVKANLFEAVTGKLEVQHIGDGLWSFVGTGGLSQVKFHADASAEMGPPRAQASDTTFRYVEPEEADSNAPTAVKLVSGFGPVIERTIPIPRRNEACVLDLESGELLTPPDNVVEKLAKNRDAITGAEQSWMSANSADVFVKPDWSKCSLMTLECATAYLDEAGKPLIWDETTSAKLTAALAPLQSRSGHGFFYSDLGATTNTGKVFGFFTREGGTGLLEITGFTDNPRGVKLRYKLVEANLPQLDAESVVPGEFRVATDGSGTYSTIQAAINAASDGAVIHIAPGRYAESLVVRKSVSLAGAGWDKTVIGPTQPWTGPSPEALLELERKMNEAKTDADRTRHREEAKEQFFKPVLRLQGAKGVRLAGIKFTLPGVAPEGRLLDITVVEARNTEATITDCAVVGSPGNGIVIADGAAVTMSNSLVAAAWNTGLRVERGTNGHVVVTDSDIRNCHYAGIVIGRGQSEVRVESCRISGAAWHGIRYDDASPTIADSLIFGNARSGIYASGKTAAHVRGNAFWKNEMNGMSCWFENQDRIENNTFAANLREGLSILGASKPAVSRNIFWQNLTGIQQSNISGKSATAQVSGKMQLRENAFWTNRINLASSVGQSPGDTNAPATLTLTDFAGNLETDPGFGNPGPGYFLVSSASSLAKAGIGASNPPSAASPWALQPEEMAIIPDADTRDSRQWKRPDGR